MPSISWAQLRAPPPSSNARHLSFQDDKREALASDLSSRSHDGFQAVCHPLKYLDGFIQITIEANLVTEERQLVTVGPLDRITDHNFASVC